MTVISLPDPCPHVSRLAVIAARLHNDTEELLEMSIHVVDCKEKQLVNF